MGAGFYAKRTRIAMANSVYLEVFSALYYSAVLDNYGYGISAGVSSCLW